MPGARARSARSSRTRQAATRSLDEAAPRIYDAAMLKRIKYISRFNTPLDRALIKAVSSSSC
jgi:hypothetical protein